jgi:hypothetical protein
MPGCVERDFPFVLTVIKDDPVVLIAGTQVVERGIDLGHGNPDKA